MDYADIEYPVTSAQLVFAMLGMGALLGPDDFRRVLAARRGLIVGLGMQFLVVPVLALGVGAVLALSDPLIAGLIMVAAVPGGTMSNIATFFAKANIALSISLTAICTLAALVTTPVLLRLFLTVPLPGGVEMPTGRIAFEIAATLLTPLLIGMLVGARDGVDRDRFSKICIRISLGFIVVIAIGGATGGRISATSQGWAGPAGIVLLVAAIMTASTIASRLARIPREDRTAILIEAAMRNTNLALLLKASLFPAVAGVEDAIGDAVLFVILLYAGASLGSAAIPILLSRRDGDQNFSASKSATASAVSTRS